MNFKSKLQTSFNLVDLTPVVDVIFLLLIFFLLTSDILPLKSLNIENPKLKRDSAPLTSQLLVVMDAQNVIYLGPKKDIVDLVSLKDHLLEEIKLLKQEHPEANPAIVLSVDKRVEYDAFLKLFSISQQCGSKVRLVYRPQDDSPFAPIDVVAGDF
jgi:biopolymer transport protein ExbD